jgi:hypothetical protein
VVGAERRCGALAHVSSSMTSLKTLKAPLAAGTPQ